MKVDDLFKKALQFEFFTAEEGLFLYTNTSASDLMFVANELRKIQKPDGKVTWLIDRNINITNVCISACKFCNFHRPMSHEEAYITTIEEYKTKIEEMLALGGKQLLLQGGLHPKLGLSFYIDLFKELKKLYPEVKLHALGPPEVVHLAKLEGITYKEVLVQLTQAGLDSLPGAGAEILVDRVRQEVSKIKCTTQEWLDVMRVAHQLLLITSATMMFGHIETLEERFEHLTAIRAVQAEKPADAEGFVSFIPWPFQDEDTILKKRSGIENKVTADEYVRMIAISRIMLPNIKNIQASWLTVGKETAQLCLHAGANDFGSIMIEENVVSSAGSNNQLNAEQMQEAIREAGFIPQQRNQDFSYV